MEASREIPVLRRAEAQAAATCALAILDPGKGAAAWLL